MIFQYDLETDMLYIKLSDRPSSESEEISPGIVLDYDEQNQVAGVEIEEASRKVDLGRLELKSLPITTLIMSEMAVEEKAK
jgi:uncharacterized protein YuzE